MFGSRTYSRNSFERRGALDDQDPESDQAGIWEGTPLTTVTDGATKATVENEPIAGNFKIYLRAFDPSQKEGEVRNRVNLPQPIHMAQFVLFELGYWLVCGEKDKWGQPGNIGNRNTFTPDGWFGRYTQWAIKEFQCYAKYDYAAREDVASDAEEYWYRVMSATGDNRHRLTGNARYPDDGKVDGTLNEETRKALQAWTDGALRCPVFVCASKYLI